jgi:2-desacetyl-2-hydroxyethyl bacteriochlorophyllide A dehydrogenase
MRQLRLHGADDLRLDEVAVPTLKDHDVLVKVAAMGICGSDLHFIHAGGPGGPLGRPLPLGHEVAGEVAEFGTAVAGLRRGQRIVVDPMRGGNNIGIGSDAGGGADYLLVRNAGLHGALHPIPDAMAYERAVLAEPLAVGRHAINQAGFRDGEPAVVFGAGPIGLGMVASLRYLGARQIAVVDIVDERLDRAAALGATMTINTRRQKLKDTLTEAFGTLRHPMTGRRSVDCGLYLDAAGVAPLVAEAVSLAPPGGRIILVAAQTAPLPLDVAQVMSKELVVRGSLCYPTEFPEVLAMLADPAVDLSALISHVLPVDHYAEAFRVARTPAESAKVVLRF